MLSLILPTYNESENIPTLVEILEGALAGVEHEIIIVDDDSPDRTWYIAQKLAANVPSLRIIRRMGRRGLSSAVIEGFNAARGTILAVMDADGQHDPGLLLSLTAAIENGADMAIGSRYAAGGSVGEWVRDRRIVSRIGTRLAQAVARKQVTDPLGGFFAIRAPLYRSIRSRLHPSGFKILLELLAALPPGARIAEVPLIFRMRLHGRSKLSLWVECQFVAQILRLLIVRSLSGARFLPTVFWLTAVVVFLALVPRAWSLKLLVLSGTMRATAGDAIAHVAREEGWRLSDITLLRVSREEIRIRYREHLRSPQHATDCTVALTSHFPLTCDGK